MKRPLITRSLLWATIVGSPCATAWWLYADAVESTNAWLTESLKQGDIELSIAATGTLEPSNYVDVGAQVSGQIKSLLVSEGDIVKQGQLLAEIDATSFAIQVKQTQASLENQKAQLKELLAELDLNKTRYERNIRLHAKGAVSDDDLKSSETDIAVQEAKLAAMKAEIKADEASLEGDLLTLSYSKIYAPIDGTVTSISVRQGQTLNASSSTPTLMTISNLEHMTLRSSVSEADIARLEPGMKVRFSTLGSPQDYFYSTVEKVLPTPTENNDVVLYQVLVNVDNREHKLMDGMSTQVFFIEQQAQDVLMLPLAAIQRGRGRQTMAKVLSSEHDIALQPIKLGIQNRTHAEVIEGLTNGQMVIIGQQNSASKNQQAISLTSNGSTRIPGGGRRGF